MAQKPKHGDIARTAARIARQVELALSKIDLSLAQYRVLYQLAEGTVASSKLATQISVSPPSIPNVVDGLANRGLVQRTHSDDDRRRVSISLTAEGSTMLEMAEKTVEQHLCDLAAEVGEEGFVAQAISGLGIWQKVFVAHRLVRAQKTKQVKVPSV